MKITAEPRSDQWNADDFAGSSRTFTIAGIREGKAEQKYDIELVEGEGRVWRPPLSMLRVLLAVWGDDSDKWRGQKVTLYNDPNVKFGRDLTGGIRISHMTGITKPVSISITVTRGKRAPYTVQPLADAPQATPTREERVQAALKAIHDATNAPTLANIWERIEAGGLDNEPTLIDASTQRTDQINQL